MADDNGRKWRIGWVEIAALAGVGFASNLIGFFAATAIQIAPVKEDLAEVKAHGQQVESRTAERIDKLDTRLTIAEARALVNTTTADNMKETLGDVKTDVAWIKNYLTKANLGDRR